MKYKVVYSDICPQIKKEELYKHSAFLGASLNNAFFWDKHLNLLLEWIDKRFSNSLVIVGDYLDRHNQFIENPIIDPNEAIKKSLSTGKILIDRFNECIENSQLKNIHIHQWQDFYELDIVKTIKHDLFQTLEQQKDFHDSVSNTAKEFLERNDEDNKSLNANHLNCSIEYIIEEMAVFSHLISQGYRVQLYPGTQLKILKQLASREIAFNTNLSTGIYVDLSVKKVRK